ncbi:MAG TPA: TerB N-terminal domain-containing protein [Thermoanaerobaculia bacterium]|nr:TerB N-terminal domain-containing protein [Thermoanaerobaculia bacterium]
MNASPKRVQKAKAVWVPPGQAVTVGKLVLPDGMLYFGKGLRALNGLRAPEPALIDPSLPHRKWAFGRAGSPLEGSVAYRDLSAEARGAYLEWLAGGRSAPDVHPVYPLLSFYGIERRVLYDVSDVPYAEIVALLAEVERLLKTYPAHAQFRYAAAHFVALVRLLIGDFRPEAFEPFLELAGHRSRLVWEIGPALLAAAGQPLSPALAFALWNGWGQGRRTSPAFRCPEEVRNLFGIRYREILPAGIRLQQKRTLLTVRYHPASPSLPPPFVLRTRIPEVRHSREQMEQLQRVADRVFSDLAPYSRWIRQGGTPTSPAALAILPPELARGWESEESRRLVRWIEKMLAGEGCAVLRREDVVRHWPVEKPRRLDRRAFEEFATFLARSGYGMEPEPRLGGTVPERGFFLFRLPDPEAGWTWLPSPAYTTAVLVLQLAVAVATADGPAGPQQEEHLLAHVMEAAHLEPVERTRLQIRLAWLLAETQSLAGCRERCSLLAESQRRAVARFLITVAGADGHVSPGEIRQLKKVYRLLGRDPQAIYADVHTIAAGSSLPVDTVAGASLDLGQVEDKLAETEHVSALLEEIFKDDEPAAPTAGALSGLDAAHAALLHELAARTTWDRAELDRRAAALGLFPDGALETLNEAAFARCGAPLLEGEETIELDAVVLEVMLT